MILPAAFRVCLTPTPSVHRLAPGPRPRFLISSPPFFLVSLPNPNFKVARKGAPKTRRPPEQRTSTHTHCRTRAAFVLAAPPARCAGGEGPRPADPGPAHSPGEAGPAPDPRLGTSDPNPGHGPRPRLSIPDPGPRPRARDANRRPRPRSSTPDQDPNLGPKRLTADRFTRTAGVDPGPQAPAPEAELRTPGPAPEPKPRTPDLRRWTTDLCPDPNPGRRPQRPRPADPTRAGQEDAARRRGGGGAARERDPGGGRGQGPRDGGRAGVRTAGRG